MDEDLVELRARYLTAVGGPDNGYALPVLEARALVALLDVRRPAVLAELGAGFSTLVLAAWCRRVGATLASFDHDPRWRMRVVELSTVRPRPLSEFFDGAQYDFVLVDHGPTMQTRLDDLPRIAPQLAAAGTLVLDDWRGSYRAAAAAGLRDLGFVPAPLVGTRLCEARRRASAT